MNVVVVGRKWYVRVRLKTNNISGKFEDDR
jgi:hypothetical protein